MSQPPEPGFELETGVKLLSRTPTVVRAMVAELPESLLRANEGPDTFSPHDVVGHLIHGERTDWIGRAKIILEHGEARPFDPFDRFAMYEESRGKTMEELLDEFRSLRHANLDTVRELELGDRELEKTGTHPELGRVTLRELLATWAVHDLNHIGQIARVLARQYADEVGAWRAYLPILAPRS